ncbi:MAG: replication initiator protein [Microvirus sp.]|nr:MAG: replication initiator protein [Microvirus sp.]
MTCYHPLTAYRTTTGVTFHESNRHDNIGTLQIACGRCHGCRMRRASDWTLRIMHEAQSHQANCAITLTYARNKLPKYGSLEHNDYQLFMKRLRKEYAPNRVRYYMCGEYGEENKRPHYHACLFGIDFNDRQPMGKSASGAIYYNSPTLERVWKHGRVSIQNLTPETAGYCARYIMKKALGDDAETAYTHTDENGEIHLITPEYSAMSLKPGIGADWISKYQRDVYPHDYVIAKGQKHPTPTSYDYHLKRVNPDALEEVKYKREIRARKNYADNTDQRLQAKETVHRAKMATFTRKLQP